MCTDDLEIPSLLAIFLVLLREFLFTRIITACTIDLVLIERFRTGIGLLDIAAISPYHFHTMNIVLQHSFNCFVKSRLNISVVFRATIRLCFDSDAALLEAMLINKRNNRHVCIKQLRSVVRKCEHYRGATNLWNYL